MPRGRPPKRGPDGTLLIDDPSIQAALFEGASKGIGIDRLCQSLGLSQRQLSAKLADDAAFRRRWYESKVAYEHSLVTKMREHANANHNACAWILERQFSDTWARKQPGVLTPEQVTAVVRRVAALAVEFVPGDKQEAFVVMVGRIMREAIAMAEQQVDLNLEAEA